MSRRIPSARQQCRHCHAHVLPLPGAAGRRCGVCGSRDLRSVDEEPPPSQAVLALRDLLVSPDSAPTTRR